MTRDVVCVQKDQTLREAAQMFVGKKISGAPVVDSANKCVGVLSAVDYVRREQVLQGIVPTGIDEDQVFQQMSCGVRAVQPEQSLLTAARLMCEKHVHRLPVLDQDDQPVGLITAMDVVAALVNAIDERETLSR